VKSTLQERGGPVEVQERLWLYRVQESARAHTFAEDVRSGLTATPKRLSPKYLYDDLGSTLFEAICLLPEYYLTRAETEILTHHGGAMLDAFGGPVELLELGSGSAVKTRLLIERALERQERLVYHPIDISPSALVASATRLIGEFDGLTVKAHADDYFEVLASGALDTNERILALFLGSNIGNYEPTQAASLLRTLASALRPGDGLLLGADLKKDTLTLERAYDDALGLTAAFNKNLLARINRELDGEFDERTFKHVAHYDGGKGSVDSFLVSQRAQIVPIAGLDLTVPFAEGEAIFTESSYKFSPEDVARIAAHAGFAVRGGWYDRARRFCVWLLVVV